MKVFALLNHKGGVGKTTSTINIGAALNRAGKSVLLIDLDPQANLSQSLGIQEPAQTIYGLIKGDYLASDAVLNIRPGLDVIPSTLDLSGSEIELSTKIGRELILREAIEPLKKKYDFILIDCPPSLGLLTVNALTASDKILIPLQAEFLAMQGLAKMLEVVSIIQKHLNKSLELGGVFITQYDSRKVLNKNVFDTITEHFPKKVFTTKIRDNVALAEAPATGQDIFTYNSKSAGAADYESLAEEILSKHTKKKSTK